MPPTTNRIVAALGVATAAILVLAVGAAVGTVPRAGDGERARATIEAAATSEAATSPAPIAQAPAPEATTTTTAAPPTTAAPAPAAAPSTTVARAAPKTAAPTTAASPTRSPAAPAAPVTTAAPKLAPGQRLNPTSAQVQAAITQLHQRIPMFSPTEPQLRTFADAVCAQLDQGQTLAQVQQTVQQAITYIQGASLSAPDAEFAVRIVVGLRCPGYLP